MIVFPNAKINLGLAIVEKRKDGFHNIETVFYPIGLSDVLEVIESKSGKGHGVDFSSSGIPIPGKEDDNLCVKAYNLLATEFDLPPVKIHLHKVIPMGAGLGGGSSDAAYFLIAINKLLRLNLSFGELHHYARKLGSDCSFFISNQVVFAQGKGDEIEHLKLSLSGYYLGVIQPKLHISTQAAYSNVKPAKAVQSIEEIVSQPISTWKHSLHNQFEDTVFINFPEPGNIKTKLYEMGALYAAMSGSGSSVFGIFSSPIDLKKQFLGSFVWEEILR